ncbi:glycosyltransferase family 2 protein [bacterium]|nr:glycosyltransferase family 2 protein [bacterium]
MKTFFSITINTFNHSNWIEKCVRSCVEQDYPDFEVLVLDDISTDGTFEICKKIQLELGDRLKIFQNDKKIYSQLKNITTLTQMSKPNSVVVSVDGDDWLKDTQVLNKLEMVYRRGNVWMTYGRYEEYPGGIGGSGYRAYPPDVIKRNSFREYDWLASHLKTYKRELFLKIDEEDFKLDNGDWLDVTGDQAFMLPMLEMSGHRSKFINETLYIYNVTNPTRDGAVKVNRQEEVANYIRGKKRYQRIESL